MPAPDVTLLLLADPAYQRSLRWAQERLRNLSFGERTLLPERMRRTNGHRPR